MKKAERQSQAYVYNAGSWIARLLPRASFILLVVIPSALGIFYYGFVASPQFVSTANFAVRGISESQLSFLAIGNIMGSSPQAPDSYIIVDYVRSSQLIRDLSTDHGVDLRTFYSGSNIDPVERVDSEAPIEYFSDYWRRKVEISYNSTTGNVTLRVRAFTAADAKAIGDAVLEACDRLVGELAAGARLQLIGAAQDEVDRTRSRLDDVRQRLLAFRELEQAVDLQQIASVEQAVIAELETRLSELETRKRSVESQLSSDSPTIRVLDRQIEAVRTQLEERRARAGSGRLGTAFDPASGEASLSAVADEFRQLTFEQEYSETAYTQALASLEAAIADARKQDRYFAVFARPQVPDVPVEPNRVFLIALIVLGSGMVWGILALVGHAIAERAT